MSSPFPKTTSAPGRGHIDLVKVPVKSSALRHVEYQYPLKLVAPTPLTAADGSHVQTVYLLTYGGGLVAGDSIDLHIDLDHDTRLILLTQGSTKVFKSPTAEKVTRQSTTVVVAVGSALCYLPDPVQPFERSSFEQKQSYHVSADETSGGTGSLCVLDWVSQGRSASGEDWNFWQYSSRNDVWLQGDSPGTARRLLLRDNVLLKTTDQASKAAAAALPSYALQMHGHGIFGTLILFGPLNEKLSSFFVTEFKLTPRIGGRKWDGSDDGNGPTEEDVAREMRYLQEAHDGVLWSVSTLRGCTVVKFAAREVEGGKKWLRAMLETEGSVMRQFGERALSCLR